MRDRLREAEATLDAIRTGRVDALVVSGPRGDQTLTIDATAHPYFVLLNAMGDGAALLELGGAIVFANRRFGDMTGVRIDKLRGSTFQRLVTDAQRPRFERFLRAGSSASVVEEFTLKGRDATSPVTIALSILPDATAVADAGAQAPAMPSVLMAIITDLRERKAAERTRARLLEGLIAAEDQERRRISRELHDETGQSLTAILVGLRAMTDMSLSAEARTVAARLREVALRTAEDVSRLARGLHPAVLDEKGLASAASGYVADYVAAHGTAVNFVAGDLDTPPLAPTVSSTMYRLLQEALTNVARHSRARKVSVELKRDASMIELRVRDNGIGFNVEGARARSSLGLRGMLERVTLLGGTIEIDSRADRGTVLRARVPTSVASSTAPFPTPR